VAAPTLQMANHTFDVSHFRLLFKFNRFFVNLFILRANSGHCRGIGRHWSVVLVSCDARGFHNVTFASYLIAGVL
jgi:hypothetical protein